MAIQLDLPVPLYANTSITATLTFANPDAPTVPVDPGSVTVYFLQGSTWTTYTYADDGGITKVSTGVYTVELPVTASGQGIVVGVGTDACAVTEVAYFSALTPPGP